ncbi:LOW QUALITY PROTEIN: hypothetical protein PanWU01x14_025130 [Parasponia andersonii]|uniref:Uncharacterized protein n=1 Tax=Parasponia andersonii TaxID=3476 RepID=A0A2P5DWT7_PARAD|nr:LOW QUALITY PROTEIN: hypothetical protein PanWU01x14_025130 [Parasponia andersonii]
MASMEDQAGSAHKGIHHLARILHVPYRAATCPDMNSQRGRAKLGTEFTNLPVTNWSMELGVILAEWMVRGWSKIQLFFGVFCWVESHVRGT